MRQTHRVWGQRHPGTPDLLRPGILPLLLPASMVFPPLKSSYIIVFLQSQKVKQTNSCLSVCSYNGCHFDRAEGEWRNPLPCSGYCGFLDSALLRSKWQRKYDKQEFTVPNFALCIVHFSLCTLHFHPFSSVPFIIHPNSPNYNPTNIIPPHP